MEVAWDPLTPTCTSIRDFAGTWMRFIAAPPVLRGVAPEASSQMMKTMTK
jgi:hypothetical protein